MCDGQIVGDTEARVVEPRTPLWRNRDYVALWTGETISDIGSQMSFFLFPLLAYAVTGSTFQAGLTAAAYATVRLALLLPAGALVDRWNRRATMLVSSACGVVLYGSVAVAEALGRLTIAHLILVSLAIGATSTFFSPAEISVVKVVVPTSQLPGAMSAHQARYQLSALTSAPLGGALYTVARWLPFAVDAVSFAISCLTVCSIRTSLKAPARNPAVPRHLWHEMVEGMRFIWSSPFLRMFLSITTIINFAGQGFFLVLTLRLLAAGVSPVVIGLIDTMGAVAGIAGAVMAPWFMRHLRPWAIAAPAAWAIVVATGLMPWTMHVTLIGALLAGMMVFTPMVNASLISYRIAITPELLQGRVQSASKFVSGAALPLGPLIGGWLMGVIGARAAMLVFVCCFAVGAVVATLSVAIRGVPRSQEWEERIAG
jgi:MFS family permease